MADLLKALPHCSDEKDNKELACKVLLGTMSQEEAAKQAQYLRDIKAKTITQGLAPELMKSYLGTKPADELLQFFDKSLGLLFGSLTGKNICSPCVHWWGN